MKKSEVFIGEFGVKIQNKNPKPGAKQYRIETVQDLFDMLTEENFSRFFKEFKQGMKVAVQFRELTKAVCKAQGHEVNDSVLKMPAFTWIDD